MGMLSRFIALGEDALGSASGLTDAQVTSIKNSLQSFGSMLLDNFIKLLPALAVIAAIMFVIALVKKKVHA